MPKIAVLSAILEDPNQSQAKFNDIIANFKGLVKGRMGIPMPEHDIAVIAITLIGELDEINSLTGKLGNLPQVTAKTTIANKTVLTTEHN